jgi:hypothetical protein
MLYKAPRQKALGRGYCNIEEGVDSYRLSPLWHIYYQLGRRTAHETHTHDRLVFDIIRIQGFTIEYMYRARRWKFHCNVGP